jgi:hypothetical protein
MHLELKKKILHRREYLAEKIGNHYHRPVEVAAIDIYGERICLGLPAGIDLHINSLVIEPKFALPNRRSSGVLINCRRCETENI